MFQTTREETTERFFVMIAKTTLYLIVITTCQTAIQFERGDTCCNCCQNTDHSYIMQSTREIIGFHYPPFKAGV